MIFLVWQDTSVLDYKSGSFVRNALGDHNVGSNVRCREDVRDNSHERIEICQFVMPSSSSTSGFQNCQGKFGYYNFTD